MNDNQVDEAVVHLCEWEKMLPVIKKVRETYSFKAYSDIIGITRRARRYQIDS